MKKIVVTTGHKHLAKKAIVGLKDEGGEGVGFFPVLILLDGLPLLERQQAPRVSQEGHSDKLLATKIMTKIMGSQHLT